MFPNTSALELGDVEGVYDIYIKDTLNHFASNSFENICIEYLNLENIKGALPLRFKTIGRWWDNKNEIDIYATDGKSVLLGECKFKNSEVTVADYKNLKSKCNNKMVKYNYIFSKSGFKENLRELAEKESLRLISLEDICN